MHNSFATAACLTLFIALAHSLTADEPTVATSLGADEVRRIDAIFSDIEKRGGPGCAIAVAQNGQVLYSRGYGLAQLEYGIPIATDTIFHVASVSKQFTTFAVALLEADEKLDLDDDIRTHVPEVPDFGHRITLRHLIHHTSGLRDQWDLFQLAGGRMDDVISESDLLELVARQRELNFAPGEEHLYCNTGYTLLAVVVSRVTGKSFKDFCQQRMFQPLGMTRTHFHDDHRHIVPSRAYSYNRTRDGSYQNLVLSYANAGATSLFTTVEDLSRWQYNFASRDVGDSGVFAAMLTPGKLNNGEELKYGGGLSFGFYRGLETIGHSGGDAGFRSYLVKFPTNDLSIVVLGNHATLSARGRAMKIADVVLAGAMSDSVGKNKTNDENAKRLSVGKSEQNRSPSDAIRFVGWYFDRASQAVYTVKLNDGRLQMQTGFRRPIELHQTLPTQFESTDPRYRFRMEFHPQADLLGRAVITFSGRSPRQLEAVEEKKPDADYSSILPGRYYSEELDVFYDIVADRQKLIVVRRRHEDAPMRLRFHDCFAAGGNSIRLSRNTDGQVDGFLLSTGRVRNLRFRRVVDWP